MDQIVHILAEQFLHAFISQSAQAGRVAERAAVFEINPINGFGGRVEKKPESVLTVSQRLFPPFSLCDVGHHADYPHHLAVGVEGGPSRIFEPGCSTIRAQRSKADLISRVLRSEPSLHGGIQSSIIWMNPRVKLPTGITLWIRPMENVHTLNGPDNHIGYHIPVKGIHSSSLHR